MDDVRCANCGHARWDHYTVGGGDLMCPMTWEDPEPDPCWFCEDGWPRVERGRKRNIDYPCDDDPKMMHTYPADTTPEPTDG